MEDLLKSFPEAVHDPLRSLLQDGGKLDASQIAFLCQSLRISHEALMVRLLPLAAEYALVPVSQYKVGAVALGGDHLYLGANMEFAGQALHASIHAEQSVITNAWLHGESTLQLLASTAPPCGHCRQFLHELNPEIPVTLLIPSGDNEPLRKIPLSTYLPNAFGPHDLGQEGGMMAPPKEKTPLNLQQASDDPLVLQALEAAQQSYAPYTHNYAGCVIQTMDGKISKGRYAENAAYNPSLSPLQSSLTFLQMNYPLAQSWEIERTILVEVPTRCSQLPTTQNTLTALAPGRFLEYHQAEVS